MGPSGFLVFSSLKACPRLKPYPTWYTGRGITVDDTGTKSENNIKSDEEPVLLLLSTVNRKNNVIQYNKILRFSIKVGETCVLESIYIYISKIF